MHAVDNSRKPPAQRTDYVAAAATTYQMLTADTANRRILKSLERRMRSFHVKRTSTLMHDFVLDTRQRSTYASVDAIYRIALLQRPRRAGSESFAVPFTWERSKLVGNCCAASTV